MASSLRLAAVGQDAEMAQTLQTVGHHRQEKTADKLVRWQGHGLDAMAWASVAAGKAPRTVLHIDETVVGDGPTVGIAPERGAHLRRSCQRSLGIDNPRLVLAQVLERMT